MPWAMLTGAVGGAVADFLTAPIWALPAFLIRGGDVPALYPKKAAGLFAGETLRLLLFPAFCRLFCMHV